MAETLTYDPSNDTTTLNEEGLTPEEQDSLQVGEEMAQKEGELLAGKYKNAEDLEKAYVELQKKLGEKGDETSETTGDTESSETETDSKETDETGEYSEGYLEDGSVNYEKVNEAYGEQLGTIFKNSDVDPWSISKHFHENNGVITDDMYKSLEGAGLSRPAIDSYLAGRAIESGYTQTQQEVDVSDSDISSIKNSVGGDSEYNDIVTWAGQNLDSNSIQAFDDIVSGGNVQAIKLAIQGLKSQYENANGYEGRMLTGKSAKNSSDVFRSQAELIRAMNDPRYDDDPAYRMDVIEKLDRSDVDF